MTIEVPSILWLQAAAEGQVSMLREEETATKLEMEAKCRYPISPPALCPKRTDSQDFFF
jgi:hypothetical protein